ncbi:hypothetical protein BBJ28_00024074, partial [Nothophytophthora sp. Chile5]
TTGMRVAFALAAFLVVEALCGLLLAVLCTYFSTETALLSSLSLNASSSGKWWVLAIAISIGQALVLVIVMPTLRSITKFSGCVEVHDWRKKLVAYEAEQQKKAGQSEKAVAKGEGDGASDDQSVMEDSAMAVLEPDSGWRAVKFLVMMMLVYAHCILGILNYPMALFCAIPMAHFARVVPAGVAPLSKNLWSGLYDLRPTFLAVLLTLTRLGPFLCCSVTDVLAGAAFIVDSFVQRINLLALPYACCIYVAVHTLSLAIWLFPVSSEERALPLSATKKRKQE